MMDRYQQKSFPQQPPPRSKHHLQNHPSWLSFCSQFYPNFLLSKLQIILIVKLCVHYVSMCLCQKGVQFVSVCLKVQKWTQTDTMAVKCEQFGNHKSYTLSHYYQGRHFMKFELFYQQEHCDLLKFELHKKNHTMIITFSCLKKLVTLL